MGALKECPQCHQIRNATSDFYFTRLGGKTYPARICKPCTVARLREDADAILARRGTNRRPSRSTPGGMTGEQRRAHWATYKRDKGCADCGTTAWECLEFDHLPGEIKLFNISQALSRTARYSDLQITAEVAKCEVVCRSCHTKRTAFRKRGPTVRQLSRAAFDDNRKADSQ